MTIATEEAVGYESGFVIVDARFIAVIKRLDIRRPEVQPNLFKDFYARQKPFVVNLKSNDARRFLSPVKKLYQDSLL